MCGIAGMITPQVSPPQREELVACMNRQMLHRGPDEGGLCSIDECTLGMRRLSIYDPANGHQPMRSPEGRHTIVFNGAIYNFRELRHELEGHGHRFNTECDTEVLLAAFAQWGAACTTHLRGMYAFAVWDKHRRQLTLARDPLGIKPLYYTFENGTLLFASEVNALLSTGRVQRDLDQGAVVDFLRWFSVPAPRTLYRAVRALQPGEIIQWEEGRLSSDCNWTLERLAKRKPNLSRAACAEELKGELTAAIRAHMSADVPVGAFLSGGIDSALITALMARESGSRLKTFSVGLEHESYDESTQAAESAAFLRTEHHTFMLSGGRVAHDISRIVAAMDQPTGDGVNTYYASLAAREGGVTVALSGLGGDEIFGGYPSFGDIPRLARLLPRWRMVPGPLRSLAVAALRRGDMRKLKLADFLDYASDASTAAALHRRVNSEPSVTGLLRPEFRHPDLLGSPLHPRHDRIAAALKDRHPADVASAYELQGYMADVLLHDSDMMSMRHSLELRVPFVDIPLLSWAWSQNPAHKYTDGHPKHLLTLAFRDILPPGTITRRKRGFSLPFDAWMRAELRPFLDDAFSPTSIAACPFLDPAEVQGRWAAYLARQDTREWSRLWSLAMLISVCKRGGNS